MRPALRIIVVIAIALALSAQSADSGTLEEFFEQDIIVIETAANGCFKFDVFLASNTPQQQRGLMFVRHLPETSGMLFLYKRAAVRSMWMKNTYISLDILFIRGDGGVSSIQANTEPLSLKSVSAIEPVNFVLELNAGTAARLGIGEGSRLILGQIGPDADSD